jgi:hypothetical protein
LPRPASGRSTARLAPSVSKAAMTQNSMASQIDLGIVHANIAPLRRIV